MKNIHPTVRLRPKRVAQPGLFIGRLLIRLAQTMNRLEQLKTEATGLKCRSDMWQGDIYIAQQDEKIIGFCRVESMNMLVDLVVEPSAQRKGVATKLVRTVTADRTFVYARSAKHLGQFWSKQGFEPEALLDDIVMWRYAKN